MRVEDPDSSPSSRGSDSNAPPPADDGPFGDNGLPSDDDGDDRNSLDYFDADDRSRTSSAFSDAEEEVTSDRLVHLAAHHCRVRMTKREGPRQVRAVCGLLSSECSRRSHGSKRDSGDPLLRGPTGFYVAYVNPEGVRSTDGRADERVYTPDEYSALRARELTERELVRETAGEDEGEPAPPPLNPAGRYQTPRRTAAVNFDLPQDQGGLAPTAPTPQVANRSVPTGDDIILGPSPPTASPSLWFCLENTDGQRAATTSADRSMELQDSAWVLHKTVRSKAEATDWCNRPRTKTSAGQPPIDLTGTSPGTSVAVPPPSVPTTSNGHTRLLQRISQIATGRDPSEGSQLIHGIIPAHESAMDEFLLPPGLTDPDSRSDFYDLAMDVPSLPGGYKQTDNDDLTNNEAFIAAISKGRNTNFRAWRRPTFNALGRIASKGELLRFVSDVEKTVLRTRLAQQNRMRKFLFSCCHDTTLVELYVVSGPLPHLMEQTYLHFLALLNILRSAAFEFHMDTWKGSYVERMTSHHATELGHIRQTASDYRMHLLETYVYLRNSRKEKFQDPSFMRTLVHHFGTRSTPSESMGGPAGSTEDQKRCGHCRRSGFHSGISRDDCPLKPLSRSKASDAVRGLTKTQAKKVYKAVKDAYAADPSADLDQVVADARD